MQSFNLKIVTPDGVRFEGACDRFIVRTSSGDIAVLARHIDYVTSLGIGKFTLIQDGVKKFGVCNGGVLSVMKGDATILASTFEWAEDIDVERAKRALAKGKERLANATDKKDIELAKLRISRALTRQTVAEESIN